VHRALKEGKPYKHIRRTSNTFIAENMGVPIKDENGKIIGAVEIIVDITERVSLEERLQKHLVELEAKVTEKTRELMFEKEEVLTMLTHDLKTPLTSILGYCSILLEDEMKETDAHLRPSVEGINVNAERMLNLIRNFLAADRMNENKFKIEPVPVKIEPILMESILNMDPQLKEKDLSIEIDMGPDLPQVTADREHMERVFYNLLSNAVKFTPAGGRITVGAHDSGDGFVNLKIGDTGSGIPKDELPLLFDKYFQGSNRNLGTGLGLFIAKKVIEAHRGNISVSSMDGKGTTFTIRLPYLTSTPT